MIFITDELGKFEKNIIELAENVGFKECKTIEAIDLFCGISERNDVLKEKDRYYAFIDIPQYWSVRADGLNGAIYDNKTKKANIYFKNPIEKRMVSRVEWIDRNNTVYKVDYYNKYGYMYCSENVSGGNVTVREFYDRNGDIKVLEQTGPKTYTTFGTRISPKSYRGFADYLEAYLKYNKIYDENIWLTSDEILNKFAWDYGNFKISYLPQNRLNSDLTVITQTNTAFRILCSEEQQVNWYKENSNYKCDRLYSYLENNKSKFGRKEAFIITESDQLEYIEQLINDFPEITFHIAASTIMSDKLTRLDINNNVELYPCITEQKRKELFERCDIYLDINHYRELYNAVNEARVLKVAQSIGCHEMGLSFYPLKPDYAKEIDKRLDGIIAPLNYGDIVIFQYPSWIGVNYDESFVNKIKSYRDTKLIIFVQDIQKLMFDSEQAILDMEIKTLNKADLLILPSKKMHRYLKENGLDEKPVIYQTIWDMPSDICFVDHAVTRCFHFAGNYNRFPFLAEYHGKTPIYQYDANKPDRENDDSFCWRGYFEQEKLMHELSKGGFGLVWSDDEYFDRYYSMNQPYKLGTNLAAGIPVIVKRGCVHEKFVERNGLGYAVDTLDEADKLVQSITDAEYIKLYHNVKNIQKLILDGAYTRKTLQDAIIEVLENACTPVENRYQDHI